jgi:hypothetical protein
MIVYDSHRKNSSLISYNPSINKAEVHLEKIDIGYTSALSLDNKLFIYLSDNTVIEYDTHTKQYKELIIPTKMNSGEPVSLFFDNEQRLWVDNFGYFDFSENKVYPQWFQIIRPSVFLKYIDTQGLWRWSIPSFTYESTNGVLWFNMDSNFGAGTGWVDPKTGVWCIFTSFSASVQADSEENLWIFVDDSLYKLDNGYTKLISFHIFYSNRKVG